MCIRSLPSHALPRVVFLFTDPSAYHERHFSTDNTAVFKRSCVTMLTFTRGDWDFSGVASQTIMRL